MQFALLGDHPAGVAMAAALVATGRHKLAYFSGVGSSPAAGAELLAELGLTGKPVGDVEEILADPAIEAVIVASPIAVRPAHLRRALQAERHVLCVHPPDAVPDIAYEAALIQGDTGRVLMSLLGVALHPAIGRLGELWRSRRGPQEANRLLVWERSSHQAIVTDPGAKPTLPDWPLLRALGGEIVEVSAFATGAILHPDEPLLVSGRFEAGGLFQATLLANQAGECLKIRTWDTTQVAELTFSEGLQGPSQLRWVPKDGTAEQHAWEPWEPWPRMVELFEAASAGAGAARQQFWQDTIRCLDLDDAARRSLTKRRTHTLEFQDVSEEVGFKSTMTLVGCAVLWGILGLLILSAWFPALKWAIVPILVIFLLLQILRWVIPPAKPGDNPLRENQ